MKKDSKQKIMIAIYNQKDLTDLLEKNEIVVIYFSNDACNVCKVIKPKISKIINTQFPKAKLVFIDTEKSPVIAGQYTVFTIPTVDIHVQGKQHMRFSRNIAMFEFEAAMQKPYSALFSE